MTQENIDILQIDHLIQTNFNLIHNSSLTKEELQKWLQDDTVSQELKDKLIETYKKSSENNLNEMKNFYLLDTVELIRDYKKSLNIPIKINFFDNNKTNYNDDLKKNSLIHEYIEKIKDYNIIENGITKPDINMTNTPLKNQRCTNQNCNSQNMTESIEYSGIVICLDCGYQETTMNLANSIRLNHNDSKRINICPKFSYDKKTHFLNCINQYQGKHKLGIDKDILTLIKNEIKKYKLKDYSKKTRREKYENVTKEHIFLFVKELKLTKCYGDINLIHNLITDHPLNDISHLQEKLLQDFEQFVQMHYKLFAGDSDKKNFNYQHLLYQLLLRHKYKCNPSEFNFLKTIDRKYYHDEICRTIFENLGWNYSSFF